MATFPRRIVAFGTYNPKYPRNRNLFLWLRDQGVEVIEVNERGSGLMKYARLLWRLFIVHPSYDAVYVGFPGHSSVILAWLVCRKPIYFDAFISLYDTNVDDRHTITARSPMAKWYAWLDRMSCMLATKVAVDTPQHAVFFKERYGLAENKIQSVLVATDISIFKPAPMEAARHDYFTVFWHGKCSPLHNIEIMLDTADMLRSDAQYRFVIVGAGPTFRDLKKTVAARNLHAVQCIESVPYEQLPKLILQADACLGIFGDSAKVDRVVPNKIYEYLACGKVVVTRSSVACRDILRDAEIYYTSNKPSAAEVVEILREIRQDKGTGYVSERNRKLSLALSEQSRREYAQFFSLD